METTTTSSTAPKGKQRVNAITGIHMQHVDATLVLEALERFNIPKGDDLEQNVVVLWGHVNEATPAAKKITCAQCFAPGHFDEDNCAFCGHDEALSKEKEEELRKKNAAPAMPALAKAAPKDDKKKLEAQPIMTTTTTETPKTNGKAKHAKDDTKPSTALRSEKELDVAVREVERLKGGAAASYHELGTYMLNAIYGPQLWKLRADKDGKQKYKNVDAFAHAELGMTPQNAYKLMEVAKNFSVEQVRAFGTTKFGLLLEAPKAERAAIQEKIESGASKREVEAAVRAANKGREGEERGGRSGVASNEGKRVKPPKLGKARAAGAKVITVAKILGTQKVKLFAKASVKNFNFDPKVAKPAKRVADLPFGKLELTNEVSMFFAVVESASGQLELKVTTSRDE